MAQPASTPAGSGYGVPPPTAGMPARPSGGLRSLWAFFDGATRVGVLERYGPLTARILISQIFLLSGLNKILDPQGTQEYMASREMFWIPFFLVAATAVELGGGLSVLLGYKARLGALALFLFLIPVTLVFHNFWTYPPAEQKTQMLFLMHNVTLMGALVLLMSTGPGLFSIDLRKRRAS